jgi:peptidoglycan/xylan/chitin deacetylase (PgdA/CDA1 family)
VTDTLVLCYHAVSERWPADLAVTPAQLHAQLSHLLRRGYAGATFTAAVSDPRADKTLAVTFDDAYASVLDLAFPVLERLGLPGTVYVPTAWAGSDRPMSWPGIDQWTGGPWEDELRPLSWDQIRHLAEAGWEVGSHTRTHPLLTRLDDARLAGELADSRHDCESALGRPCSSVAYPYGDVDDRVVAAALRAGYRAGAALPARAHRPQPLQWPRLAISREDSPARFRRQTRPLTRRLLASRAGPLAERSYAHFSRRMRPS